jgi:type 1 glutamine amidotransferase
MRRNLALIAFAALCFAHVPGSPALAATDDCPLAHEPYSSRSPLFDLLIDPAARAVVERIAPAMLKPPFGDAQWPTQPPSFAAILTPASMVKVFPQTPASALAELDVELAKVPVTPQAIVARCARYDHDAPPLPAQIKRPAILVFEKSTGFRDTPSVDAAAVALDDIARQRGWTLVTSHSGAVFNARDLARFDAVIWNNVSGDVLTVPQRAAFRHWIESGGGYAGIHGSGGDPAYFWDWYVGTLVGAQFIGHPLNPQFQEALVVVEDRASPVTAGLGEGWRMTEEWYSFAASPRSTGANVLAKLDESTYSPVGMGGTDLHMGDHPIAWTRCIDRGRSFYTAIGHRPENYREPHSVRLLEQGIAWAMDRAANCQE